MSLSSLISSNLNFAIGQINVSLTTVPSNGETYSANKQDADISFEIFQDGREITIDTKFFINKSEYSSLPTKGVILTDGVKNYKVMALQDDAVNITRRLDCASEYQR